MTKSRFRVIDASNGEMSDIAKVLSNKTAQKILSYLDENAATESELAKDLNLSVSTVHYNMKQLKQCKLIVEDAMHYSPKGKEVIHYKATNEHIIISPRNSFDLMEKLQTLIPVVLLLMVAFVMVEYVPFGQSIPNIDALVMSDMLEESSPMMAASPRMDEPVLLEPQNSLSSTGFILIGMAIGVLLAFIALYLVHRLKKE